MPRKSQSLNKYSTSAVNLGYVGLVIVLAGGVKAMDVIVAKQITALNGTNVKISCIFTSCYQVDEGKFAMNWSYQETGNDTKEMFMVFQKKKMETVSHIKFDDRVTFVGTVKKNDLSVKLADVQLSDEGFYHCWVRNPPDRVQGLGVINLQVVTKLPPPRDTTIAVVIGASVGGILALLILSMVVVKCIRRQRKQDLISDEQKMEEEGKLEADVGGGDDGTKNVYPLPEDVY